MTYLEIFETLKKKILNIDESKLKKSFAIQVNVTDEDCDGSFYIANVEGLLAVEPYDYYDHTSMITASSKAFTDLLSGKLNPVKAFLSGDIAIEGDIEDLKTLSSAIKKTQKLTSVKSAKAEKETVKKKEPPKKIPPKRVSKKITEED